MIWADVKQLEKLLIDETLPEKDVFYYLLTSSLITTIASFSSYRSSDHKILLLAELLFGVGFTILLLRATFGINNAGDKKDYLKRYTSLSLVVFIRIFLFALVPIMVITLGLLILESMSILKYDDISQIFVFSATILVSIAYYVMLTNSFKRVSRGK